MDAINQLKQDHDQLKQIMNDLETAANTQEGDKLDQLFKRFRNTFNLHDRLEDEKFYPALKKHSELAKLALKGWQAHHMAEVGILELRLLPFNSESWGPKFSVIRDSILTHMDEEENEVFAKAQEVMKEDELNKLGDEMDELREYVEKSWLQ